MLAPTFDPNAARSGPEIEPAFSVVVAYEDLETGRRAQRTCDFLMHQLGGECRFINQMWRFDALAVPSLRELGANDAALADLIFISCHGNMELPIDVKAWIELWLGLNGAAFGLVALFDRSNERSGNARTIHEYLASAARRGEMEFFPQPDDWQGLNAVMTHKGSELARDPRKEQNFQITAVPTKNRNVWHWGLNE